MRKVDLPLFELALITGTRALAGAASALLSADKLTARQRKTLGWTLFIIAAGTTIPLALDVMSRTRRE